MHKKRINFENFQLYELFSQYDKYINNTTDRDLLIGYSVLEGIINHEHQSKAFEEQIFEEIKSIYNILNQNLDNYKKNNEFIFEMASKVNNQLENIASKEQVHTNIIEKNALTKIQSKKPKSDYIRNLGNKLYNNTNSKWTGKRNIMLHDYETIRQIYG